MAVAANTDKFMYVGDPGTATTLSSPGYTIGASSVTIGSTSNWPTATGIVFAIDEAHVVDGVETRIAGTYNEYRGTVASGTSVTNVVWARGVGDRNYTAGPLTRVYIPVSAERENRLVDGITAQHNQDGTHAAVTATSVTATGAVQGSSVVSTGDLQLRSVSLETIQSESTGDFVASGLVWSLSSGLVGTMTSGVAYITGKRLSVSAIATRTFTASKDTYVSLSNSGTVTYTEVANGAASPALPANSVWLATVVTSGAAITSTPDTRPRIVSQTPWQAWTPTMSASSGSFTTVSAAGRFVQISKTVHFTATITITNVGTAASVYFTLPVAPNGGSGMIGYGRENAVNGKMLAMKLVTGSTASVVYYDNSVPNLSGVILQLSGTYEAA